MSIPSQMLAQKLDELVQKIDLMHPEDPDKIKCLYSMSELMIQEEQTTIDFFKECNAHHERIIYWMSPFFEDIVCKFPTNSMVDAMMSLIDKYPKDSVLPEEVELVKIIVNKL